MLEFLGDARLQAAIANLVLVFVGLFTTALLGTGAAWFRTNVDVNKLGIFKEIVAMAVKAAEQGELAGFISDKKAAAIQVVQNMLDAAKITGFTANDIDAAIEAAVLEFNQREGYVLEMQTAEKQYLESQSSGSPQPATTPEVDDGA